MLVADFLVGFWFMCWRCAEVLGRVIFFWICFVGCRLGGGLVDVFICLELSWRVVYFCAFA